MADREACFSADWQKIVMSYPFREQPREQVKAAPKAETGGFFFDFLGLCCVCAAIMVLLSLISFDQRDPNLNHVVYSHKVYYNWVGMVGAYLAGLLADLFGFASYVLVLFLAALGRELLRRESRPQLVRRWAAFPVLGCCLAAAGDGWGIGIIQVRSGGLLGRILLDFSIHYFSRTGTVLIWSFVFLIAAQSIGGFTWARLVLQLAQKIKAILAEADRQDQNSLVEISRTEEAAFPLGFAVSPGSLQAKDPPPAPIALPPKAPKPERSPLIRIRTRIAPLPPRKSGSPFWAGLFRRYSPVPSASAPTPDSPNIPDILEMLAAVPQAAPAPSAQPAAPVRAAPPPARPSAPPLPLPSLDLLLQTKSGQGVHREDLEAKGHALMTCLRNFSIQAELAGITPGPVVTTFEVRPAPGVKAARIAGLDNDLALGLKAATVRIQAPIPGTDAVGIEIPNDRRELVNLRELVASPAFRDPAAGPLLLALGKDSGGAPVMADLARMPHLLVAGATGTGKSVFLNSVLLSILYRARPEEVKLLLIDPKRVEMTVYENLPHLVHPIVKDMSLAKNALDWTVREMTRRYDQMDRLGVRDVTSFNAKLRSGGPVPPSLEDPRLLPYLVLIIDELSDLILTAGKEMENSLVRLAQLARAAGIHLIVATQRPSVDVVTGLIKANFPCRISFQVASKHDSRTILDTGGAECLLGLGDMLYRPAGVRLRRLHGAYVSDAEVEAVTDYWREKQKPDYQVDFVEWDKTEEEENSAAALNGDDQLYQEAVQFVLEQGRATISFLQRRFNIGFNRSARLIEQMEKDGIIGPADGSKPRKIYK